MKVILPNRSILLNRSRLSLNLIEPLKAAISALFSIFFITGISFAQLPPAVAIDAPPPAPPPIGFTMKELPLRDLRFGAQGVGIESCIHVQLVNQTKAVQQITSIGCSG